jgi:hypothetical protein
MERRAWTLVWDLDETLYPLAVFQAEPDAEMARAAFVDKLVEEAMEEERDEEAGDLPLDPAKLRAYFQDRLSIERWSSLPLFLTDEYGQGERDAERIQGELRDYVDMSSELDEARWYGLVDPANEKLVEQGARP